MTLVKRVIFPIGIAGALVVGAAWAVGQAPPAQQVIVLKHSLGVGHIIKASDLTVGTLRASKSRQVLLLPPALEGLIPGEYLVTSVLAGAPLLTTEIHRVDLHVKPPPPVAPGDACVPAKAI